MSLVTTYDGGTASSMGEQNLSVLKKADPRAGTKRGVLLCHGAGNTEIQFLDPTTYPNLLVLMSAIADAGYPILATRAGGDGWGNDASLTKLGLAKTYLQGTLGAKSGKIFLLGVSMGGGLVRAYARANPTLVSALIGILPVSDLNDMVVNNRGSAAASINTAYGGTYSNATHGPTHNPESFKSSLNGIPEQDWYSTDDTIVISSTVTSVAAANSSSELHTLTGGHSDTAIGQITISSILSFLAANAA